MPGSKGEIVFVILYDFISDSASWRIKSAAQRIENAQPEQFEIIWEDHQYYKIYSDMAGPVPHVLIEEITQVKQGDNDGQEKTDSNYNLNPHDVTVKK